MCMYINGYCRYCIYILFAIGYIYTGLIYMCIAIVAIWYIYIYMSDMYVCIATIRLLNSACLLGVWLYGRSRVLDIYILPVFIYSTPLADRECACVDNVAISSWYVYVCLIYMRIEHILPLSVYSTPLADRECDCVDEVACSMYVYVSMVIVATVYTYCRYLMYTYVSSIYIYIVTIRECS